MFGNCMLMRNHKLAEKQADMARQRFIALSVPTHIRRLYKKRTNSQVTTELTRNTIWSASAFKSSLSATLTIIFQYLQEALLCVVISLPCSVTSVSVPSSRWMWWSGQPGSIPPICSPQLLTSAIYAFTRGTIDISPSVLSPSGHAKHAGSSPPPIFTKHILSPTHAQPTTFTAAHESCHGHQRADSAATPI